MCSVKILRPLLRYGDSLYHSSALAVGMGQELVYIICKIDRSALD